MEGKYGRLFTQDDVVRIAKGIALIYSGQDRTEESIRESMGGVLDHFDGKLSDPPDGGPLTFPADEPLFLLRGQDEAAHPAINDYLAEAEGFGAGEKHLDAVQHAYETFGDWQRAHPDRVKVPD